MNILNKRIDIDQLIKNINGKKLLKRYFLLISGLFLSAISFNLFFLPNNIVNGGMTGISIITKEVFNIDPATFILASSIILLIFSFILLGKKRTMRTVLVVIIYPIFVSITANIASIIPIKEEGGFILTALFGGALSGIGSGLIFKTGFSGGGSDIISEILNKYFKISMGKAILITNGIIIIIGSFVFGISRALYAIISIYIISSITDKVILGISESKAFYIVTTKEESVKNFILNNLKHNVTLLDVKGGYTDDRYKMIMCVIPTRQYFIVKEVILEIDREAFFLVTDAYEVSGGA